jgi:tetratricopeptide (TPR) repeat protein
VAAQSRQPASPALAYLRAAGLGTLFAVAQAGPVRGQENDPAEPPQTDMAACYRGSAAQQEGQHALAISLYNECIAFADLPPETLAQVLTNRAASRQLTNDFEGAIRDYGAAIEIEPGRANAYNGRCWAYAMLRRPEDALADCEESLRLAPDDPYALDSRALVHWLMSRDELARADLERARALDPSFRPWQERFREFEKLVFGLDP